MKRILAFASLAMLPLLGNAGILDTLKSAVGIRSEVCAAIVADPDGYYNRVGVHQIHALPFDADPECRQAYDGASQRAEDAQAARELSAYRRNALIDIHNSASDVLNNSDFSAYRACHPYAPKYRFDPARLPEAECEELATAEISKFKDRQEAARAQEAAKLAQEKLASEKEILAISDEILAGNRAATQKCGRFFGTNFSDCLSKTTGALHQALKTQSIPSSNCSEWSIARGEAQLADPTEITLATGDRKGSFEGFVISIVKDVATISTRSGVAKVNISNQTKIFSPLLVKVNSRIQGYGVQTGIQKVDSRGMVTSALVKALCLAPA